MRYTVVCKKPGGEFAVAVRGKSPVSFDRWVEAEVLADELTDATGEDYEAVQYNTNEDLYNLYFKGKVSSIKLQIAKKL